MKQLWRNLNHMSSLNYSKSKNKCISKLYINDELVTNLTDICNGFNTYFSTVWQKLVEKLNRPTSNTKKTIWNIVNTQINLVCFVTLPPV